MWSDGVHLKVRLGQAHSCVLVLLGVRPDGTKEFVALAEGLRESKESWADLLRDCRRRGMRDPELVVGDKLRTEVTRGAGSPAAALAMV
ncbi:transposase-like protein [Embleya sp. AB8]